VSSFIYKKTRFIDLAGLPAVRNDFAKFAIGMRERRLARSPDGRIHPSRKGNFPAGCAEDCGYAELSF
jgi:hypothetical protein